MRRFTEDDWFHGLVAISFVLSSIFVGTLIIQAVDAPALAAVNALSVKAFGRLVWRIGTDVVSPGSPNEIELSERYRAHFYATFTTCRKTAHEPKVDRSDALEAAALARLQDMQLHRYYGHYGPSGNAYRETIAALYPGVFTECLAVSTSPELALLVLLSSPAHRDAMLGEWTSVGVAVGRVHDTTWSAPAWTYVVVLGHDNP